MTTSPRTRYLSRELSWLKFNQRVLEEAQNVRHPLLERVKFLAIFATNLDEFFMVRVSGLRELMINGLNEPGTDGLTPQESLDAIAAVLEPMLATHSALWALTLRPELVKHGVRVMDWAELSDAQRATANAYYDSEVHPVLTPLAVDTAHPFPHISNLSLSLAIALTDEAGRTRMARVKVPATLPRLVALPGDAQAQHNFIWLDQMIAANIRALFPGVTVLDTATFRVTRDTDIEIVEDESADLLEAIESQVKERRFGQPVRLEVDSRMPVALREVLMSNLQVQPRDCYSVQGALNLADLMELMKLPTPKLKDPLLIPKISAPFDNLSPDSGMFDLIKTGDSVLFHPFDAFSPVVDFIRQAANDPLVLAIKITLYRVGKNSPVVQALIDAAQKGKQVAVVVELKARFDEENNIFWARELEDAGVHVVFGVAKLKVHSKIALVVRREADRIRRYVHLSTGNYNAGTSRLYTDVGIFTSDDQIGQDATDLFNYLTGYSRQMSYRKLSIAPVTLRKSLAGLIDREIESHLANGGGHMIFKMNSLVDADMIDHLYRASQAGVRVDLIVRGMCALRPGSPKLSENIRVVSIVGRFLEHSRAYWFRNNGAESLFLASADLMERNLDRRVEIMFPVEDPVLRGRIKTRVLDMGLRDVLNAHDLQHDGNYVRRVPLEVTDGMDSQASQLAL